MTEETIRKIETTLLRIAEARENVDRTAGAVREEGGDQSLLAALAHAEGQLLSIHRNLTSAVFFRTDETQLQLVAQG